MRLGPKIISVISLSLAALGCWLVASIAATVIEEKSGQAVEIVLIEAGHEWADVHTDGLQVHIGGEAPNEARRFNALHLAGTVVDATRVVDGTTVKPSQPLAPPRFSIEILRNDEGITLIGLVPDSMDRAATVNEITALAAGAKVTDLLQVSHNPAPADWDAAVHHGLNVLARLPRSKISISAGQVDITAITDSEEEKLALERSLEQDRRRSASRSLKVSYNLSAPRPVITPFTLRFVVDENGPRFDACSADTERARERILAAAMRAGLRSNADCTLGLGVPTTDWATAVGQGIDAIGELGGGSVTFSDADITLVALETTSQEDFDRVVGELESNLPEVFSLHSVLPEPVQVDGTGEGSGPPEFVATRSPEGHVQLRGRLNNALVRDTVESFAKARFGADAVHMATRIDETLPDGWPVRVLAGLQALSEIDSGATVVQEDFIDLSGRSGNKNAQAVVARLLGEKLGEGQNFAIEVIYDEAFDPVAALPTPEECVARVNTRLEAAKITFDPGSADISGSAVGLVNEIADILKACREVEMEIEIAGYTDSQGREEMNLDLSQRRAQAVLDALAQRRVLTSKITAMGYGEADPIADNGTEVGREANRRIEFRLLGQEEPEAVEGDAEATEEATAETGEEAAAQDGPEVDAVSGAASEAADTETQDAEGTEESQ